MKHTISLVLLILAFFSVNMMASDSLFAFYGAVDPCDMGGPKDCYCEICACEPGQDNCIVIPNPGHCFYVGHGTWWCAFDTTGQPDCDYVIWEYCF